MINSGFRDTLDEYFPETFSRQWDQIINGRSNQILVKIGEENFKYDTISDSACKKICAKKLWKKVILLPFDAIGRTIYSGTYTIFKILEWSKFSFLAFKDPNETNKKNWTRANWAVLDGLLATGLSPFQGSVKACRIFLAIFAPSTLYKHPLLQNIRHRKTFEIKELQLEFRKAIEKVALSPQQLGENYLDTIAYALIMKGCFDYAVRWNVFNSSSTNNNFANRRDLQIIYKKMPVDSIKEQYTLAMAFRKALQSGFTQDSFNALIQEFETEKQKQVLNRFFNKGFYTFWDNSQYHQIYADIKRHNKSQSQLNLVGIPLVSDKKLHQVCGEYFEYLQKTFSDLKEMTLQKQVFKD